MGPQETIGIVGGGQLGRMLTLAALPLGFNVVVLNPSSGSPASQVGAQEIIGDLYDESALIKLADMADYLTVEIEHLDADILDVLASQGKQINPAPKTIRLIQDKFLQKEFLHKAGIPVAPFEDIDDKKSAQKALKYFRGKMLLKTKHGAYDGRGNMVINRASDIEKAFDTFSNKQLYAEGYVPFTKELAVMVAKSSKGEVAIYPIVETIQERNICIEVQAPAQISDKQRKDAEKIAMKVARLLDGAGTFGIEMFLTENGKVIVNEIAPRVHNSGHYTMEASRTSQFEQHIRAIAGLPLGDTSMVVPAAVMINILGDREGPTKLQGLIDVLANPHVSVHLYGKSPTKIDRKMGHITATGKTVNEARKRAKLARQQLSI
ncbi:MAG: 5-(carboxyamino)imidazole ribonucleotide synthase [Candidatus Saccharibacteria bacterium]|nr:5-(carboxyamino)imidazole ribonucleotide synthase [Candidatus Saccharibacteria bacterium]